jgi:hypothetical protein
MNTVLAGFMAGIFGIFGGSSVQPVAPAVPESSSCVSFNGAAKIDYQGFEKILKAQEEQRKRLYVSFADGTALEVLPKDSTGAPAPKPVDPPSSGNRQCGCSGIVDVKVSCVKNGVAYGFLFRPVEVVSVNGVKTTKKDKSGQNVNYPRWDKGHDLASYKGEGLVRRVPTVPLGPSCVAAADCTANTPVDDRGTTLEKACLAAGGVAAGKSLNGSANEVTSATAMDRSLSKACELFGGTLAINRVNFNSNYSDSKVFSCLGSSR